MRPLDYYLLLYLILLPLLSELMNRYIVKKPAEWRVDMHMKCMWFIALGLLLYRLWR